MNRSSNGSMTRWFDEVDQDDIAAVGGKNASLGEMIRRLQPSGIRVPDGFATTAEAYRQFLTTNNLEEVIREQLSRLGDDGMGAGPRGLDEVGEAVRRMIRKGKWSDEVARSIRDAYQELCKRERQRNIDVAVRSSATAEDLPEASFAGQLESFLNVRGEEALLDACRNCFASLFTNRAISYRQQKGLGADPMKIAVSVGVQKMVRSDAVSGGGGAGVAFTLDTETGFPDVVLINAGWGLGESVVKGMIEPDEYRVFKPLLDKEHLKPIIGRRLGSKAKRIVYAGRSRSPIGAPSGETTKIQKTPVRQQRTFVLSDDEILNLARWCATIERHYRKPMDIEWARDGLTGDLYIVQARPETVESRRRSSVLKSYRLKEEGTRLLEGQAIGRAIASGKALIIKTLRGRESEKFEKGGILVASTTDPDWVPLMKRAAGIVTDHGGRTSHAAIVSRELGVPAVIGTVDATSRLKTGQEITISCAEGEMGYVYDGVLDYEEIEESLEKPPRTHTKVMINIASPEGAFRWWPLRADGVGLARIEFIINNVIKIHPLALLRFDDVKDRKVRKEIEQLTAGSKDKAAYFVDHLARGMAIIAASQYPNPVIVRFSDFKSNEYANLIGGAQFEPQEGNPMLGLRGASRYYSEMYRDGFALECAAMKRAREGIGLRNIIAMIPFCRTPEEADRVLEAMAEHGLERPRDRKPGEGGLEIYVMAEIPSNIILADEFANRFDGFSIGSNDLTQLVLGVDRDSEALAQLFEERHEAVKHVIRDLIQIAHDRDRPVPVGICGQAPSDHPKFAQFLVECGIDSISVNPDSFIKVRKHVAVAETAAGESPRRPLRETARVHDE